jgi:hypothetical protein
MRHGERTGNSFDEWCDEIGKHCENDVTLPHDGSSPWLGREQRSWDPRDCWRRPAMITLKRHHLHMDDTEDPEPI